MLIQYGINRKPKWKRVLEKSEGESMHKCKTFDLIYIEWLCET
jgi:hypothetical protein